MDAKHAKELAAIEALKAYAATLAEHNVPIDDIAEKRSHVHVALMIDKNTGRTVMVRAEWTFTTDAAEIERALAKKTTPSAGSA